MEPFIAIAVVKKSNFFVLSLLQAMSPSDHEDENDPDGPYAFKRRKTCHYHAVSIDLNFQIKSNKNVCMLLSKGQFSVLVMVGAGLGWLC
jgi:hypothetical protein